LIILFFCMSIVCYHVWKVMKRLKKSTTNVTTVALMTSSYRLIPRRTVEIILSEREEQIGTSSEGLRGGRNEGEVDIVG